MLQRQDGPEGTYYLRRALASGLYAVSSRTLEQLSEYRDWGRLDLLLTDRDAPFLSSYQVVEREPNRVRLTGVCYEGMIDIEVLPNGCMGQLRAVDASQAYRRARLEDGRRNVPIRVEPEPSQPVPMTEELRGLARLQGPLEELRAERVGQTFFFQHEILEVQGVWLAQGGDWQARLTGELENMHQLVGREAPFLPDQEALRAFLEVVESWTGIGPGGLKWSDGSFLRA